MSPREPRSDRGAVAMEAALILPILALLAFGIIEFSFLVRDYTVVTSDARIGARIAATGADAGPGTCETGPEAPPCTGETSPALAQEAADAIQRSGSAMPEDFIEFILVYKANAQGFPGPDGNTTMPSSCSGVANCVRFVWRDSADAFRYAEGVWDHRSISACFPGSVNKPLDRVGVYLQARHPMMTGMFGSGVTLSDRAVMDFEPLPTATCGAETTP